MTTSMREGERESEPMREKTFGRVKQAGEFINFKSCQQCHPVGGAFMALRSGPPHPSPTYLTPPQLHVASDPLCRPASHDGQLIIFFEASRLIDWVLWLEFIITFDLSAVSPRGCLDATRVTEEGIALSGFHIVPTIAGRGMRIQ